MCSSRVRRWEWCPCFAGTSQTAVSEGGIDHRSVRGAGSGCKMAQKHIQCAAAARGQARQTVADGEVKRIRREGPIHITVTRGHASTKCADSTGDRSTCDADSVMDKQIFLLPRQSTNAVPTVPQHGRSQRAGTWCLHASRHQRRGIERAPSSFARTTSSMEKLRQRA
ncbi:hypothetical protein TcCL_NonESM11882 [Trypanosoma cruzi]|nr:hypothetical protein TcCL_NonESM11882 [Trypanosoma cruzi]